MICPAPHPLLFPLPPRRGELQRRCMDCGRWRTGHCWPVGRRREPLAAACQAFTWGAAPQPKEHHHGPREQVS